MSVTDRLPVRFSRRDQLDEPEIHDVLRNERRRRVLSCLRDRGGRTEVSELVDSIARRECDQQPSSKLRRSVYSSLHQTHLPKLERSDIVAYDRDSKAVTLTTNASEVDRYLQLRGAYGLSWGEYYQLFAAASLIVVLLIELNVWAFGTVETLPAVTAALSLLALSGAYQVWTRRWIYFRSLLQ